MHTRVNHIDYLHRPFMLGHMLTLQFLKNIADLPITEVPTDECIITDCLPHPHAFEDPHVMLVSGTRLLVSFRVVQSIGDLLAGS